SVADAWRRQCARCARFVSNALEVLSVRAELRSGWAMSRPMLAFNIFMASLSLFLSIRICRALFAPDLQPTFRITGPVAVAAPRGHEAVRNPRTSGVYDVIAARNLFHPNRSDPTSSGATAQILPPAPTLALYGVAIGDDVRVAFVQDFVTRQTSGYKIGDKLAGGQVERIEPDRGVIMRADGPLEGLLHRPKDPRPTLPSHDEGSARRSRGRQE